MKASMRGQIIIVVVFGFYAFESYALEPVVAFPSGTCQALSRVPESLVKSGGEGKRFASAMMHKKADIVCVAQDLEIKSPIRSNGGDVVIFADNFRLLSTIDTRPYISPDDYLHVPPPEKIIAISSEKARALYNDYYVRSPQKVDVFGKAYLPELFSGSTPLTLRGGCTPNQVDKPERVGTPVPDSIIDRAAVKSGNVYIYASNISFADEKLINSIDERDPLNCDAKPVIKKVAILADGARGGRGGAGAIESVLGSSKTTAENVQFSCKSGSAFTTAGSLNAPGGKGGDAGNVEVVIINSNPSEELINSIKAFSSVDGGLGGANRKLRAPSYSGKFAAKDYTSACSFISEGDWPSPEVGKSGELLVREASSTDAFTGFLSRIGLLDASLRHDLADTAERASKGESIYSLSFSAFAEHSLYDQLSRIQIKFVESLNSRVLGVPEEYSLVPNNLRGLDLKVLDDKLFLDSIAQVLSEIAKFDSSSSGSHLDSYFFNSGGALNLRDKAVASAWARLALRIEGADNTAKFDQLKQYVSDSNKLLNSINKELWTSQYRDSLKKLSDQIAALEAEARKNSQVDGISKMADAAKAVFAGLATAYAGYQTGDGATTLGGVGAAANSAQDLLDSINGQKEEIDRIPELKARVVDVENQLSNFLRVSEVSREKFERNYASSLLDYLISRNSIAIKLDARTHLFSDLLAASLVSYFSDHSRSIRDLTFNFRNIVTFLKGPPLGEAVFSFRGLDDYCAGEASNVDSCFKIGGGDGERYMVVSFDRAGQWYDGLTAYSVAPGRGVLTAQSFGETFKTRSEQPTSYQRKFGYVPLQLTTPKERRF